MVRARLQDHLPTRDRQYRRHAPGQGRSYRLRRGESQQAPGPEPCNGGRRNEGGSLAPIKAGKPIGTALISIAAVIELREGGESAVPTTGGARFQLHRIHCQHETQRGPRRWRAGGRGSREHSQGGGGGQLHGLLGGGLCRLGGDRDNRRDWQLDTREWGGIVSVGAGGAREEAFPAATPSPAPFRTQPLTFAQATGGSQVLSTAP
jgi:hypothetical protein